MDHVTPNGQTNTAMTVALEDCIMQKGKPATAGSKILENFVAPFDATVIDRLRAGGVAIAGQANMCEFGIGMTTAPEGLSGAVKAVADGLAPLALGSDIFGVSRRMAAENGLFYIHPTYGTVSRYGLIPSACSMDQIGVACRNLTEGFKLLSVIAGHDEKDGAMFPGTSYTYAKEDRKITVGLPSDIIGRAGKTGDGVCAFAAAFNTADMELPLFDMGKQVMAILSSAEINNNISRYDGIKFGARTEQYRTLNDLYLNTRTECFGLETKLTAMIGAMVLSQDQYVPYYEKAMKVRRLIRDSLRFDGYDVIALPAAIGDDTYENLSLYALAPLAGLPSIAFSCQGQGIQLIANVKDENALLTAWEVYGR